MATREPVLTPEAAAKAWLRRFLRGERKRIPTSQASRLSARIARHVIASRAYRDARTVALFLSFGSEVRTAALVRDAWKRGKTVLLPVTANGFAAPFFAVYRPGDRLERTPHGPLEPAGPLAPLDPRKIDLVLVPGLGFDRDGHRIGYGGGVYDRLLAGTKKASHIGLFYSCQRVDLLPKEGHDHPLQGVVTEDGFQAVKRA